MPLVAKVVNGSKVYIDTDDNCFSQLPADYVCNLVAAVLLAMTAQEPHERSPASAVQCIFNDTYAAGESQSEWASRFLTMSGREYKVGWEIQEAIWTYSGDISVSGFRIAQHCLYWLQRKWDFSCHKEDDRVDYNDEEIIAYKSKAKWELAQLNLKDFLLPGYMEMVRRVWRSVVGRKLRMLDIWLAPDGERYHYAIRESGSPELLARSSEPYYPHVLKKLLKSELLPRSASKPFLVKARGYHHTIEIPDVTP